ncbi:hypothetical protein NM688_g3720 [Phlebia brevispora]|uniref:Uncharacterized protein n=1 Tax=Phlebia brevispora TaxID=194682 RepID=A0ACC1T4X6_9APHY|nr:hypothetical protein NM688_g3720 [Phlebia brevispora]
MFALNPLFITAFVIGVVLLHLVRAKRVRRLMPPGPPGVPVLGNALQVPKEQPFRQFAEWAKTYGPVFSLNILGKNVVVLNSLKVARDLLDRRSVIYSGRPRLILANEIILRSNALTLMPYGNRWRKQRRAIHDAMNIREAKIYSAIQEREATNLVRHLLDDPENWIKHCERSVASNVFSIVYGDILAGKDYNGIMSQFWHTVHSISRIASKEVHLVEIFPSMLYIPTWLAKWKRDGESFFGQLSDWFEGFFQDARRTANVQDDQLSFSRRLIKAGDKYGLSSSDSAWLAGITLLAGVDTSCGMLSVFMLVMLWHPEVMHRAQAELDAVIGRDRLPTLEDYDSLPYIVAMVKEMLRGRLAKENHGGVDDWYEDYFIPKDTMILVNLWAMGRDPTEFPDPESFRPERFLDGGKLGTRYQTPFGFGFGRRICPGMHVGMRTLFIDVACLLWALEIEPPLSDDGHPILPDKTEATDDGKTTKALPIYVYVTDYTSLAVFVLTLVSTWMKRHMLRYHMPPSPSGLPLLGNVFQVPLTEAWRTFAQWKVQLGPIFSLNMAGKDMIVLNTLEAAIELLDHRSSNYSDRPRMITAGEIICQDSSVSFVHYGAKWRKMRRATHEVLNPAEVPGALEPACHTVRTLILVVVLPAEIISSSIISSSAYSTTYGEHLSSQESSAIAERNLEFVHILATASLPVTAPYVEIFPALRYVPVWFPGANWKRTALDHSRKMTAMFKEYLDNVKANVQTGNARPCLATRLVEQQEKYGLTEIQDIWLSGTVYIVAAETTAGALSAFILAMVLFPEVLDRAQAEIDAVVGRERVPNIRDLENMPYIQALVKEVHRWFPGVPLGLARRCMQDDWFGDYLIPKGTIILTNIWAMSRDPEYFPDPERFMPERYLYHQKKMTKSMEIALEMNFAFGFGRRICLGKAYANSTLLIMIVTLVWACDIRKAKDDAGNEITPPSSACVDNGLVVRPAPFPCEIVPRHPTVRDIVDTAERDRAQWT